jgi:adenine phosphoribosyltransferase
VSDFDYESRIVSIPDYPEKGVIFKDITPLFADSEGLVHLVDDIADHFLGRGITKVVGAEARGFLVGAPVAYKLGAGFVPARKPGKLPREVYSQTYTLEYGTDELQIHKDALKPDDVVLIVDDLVATGGTAVATAKLVEQSGARIEGFSFILELTYLNPRDVISKDYPNREVYTLIPVK